MIPSRTKLVGLCWIALLHGCAAQFADDDDPYAPDDVPVNAPIACAAGTPCACPGGAGVTSCGIGGMTMCQCPDATDLVAVPPPAALPDTTGNTTPVGEPVGTSSPTDLTGQNDPPALMSDATIPAGTHCDPVAGWDPVWAQFEEEVLLITNEYRASGANCDTQGTFGPTGPLAMQGNLRCSARLHSEDMSARAYFAHDNPDGLSPTARMNAAGYSNFVTGENIAMGQTTPREVVDGWIESDGHCSNIMNPDYSEIGIGYYEGASAQPFVPGKYWTQNFGGGSAGAACPPGWEAICGS